MKAIVIIFLPLNLTTQAQNQWFPIYSILEISGPGLAFNIETFDIKKDGHKDVVVGNWNNTHVYYGGPGILNSEVDVTYTGRLMAICDFNGDGFDDMITMHFTNYVHSRLDYDGMLLFNWGSDTTELAIDTIPDYSIPLPTLYPNRDGFTTNSFKVGMEKGDLNGDGRIDLAFGTIDVHSPSGQQGNGKVFVFLGRETPLDTADFVLTRSYPPYMKYGYFFQIGNINGDNYDDLLVSSNLCRTIGTKPDSVHNLHIFYGSSNFTAISGNESLNYSSYVNPWDSTAGWFLMKFSVDDINGDGIDDLVVARSFYDKPRRTNVHYGSLNGIDTIPSFSFIQDTTTDLFLSAGSMTHNIGDFNDDGYNDFIMQAAHQVFVLHLVGPYVSNSNRYGARGYINATSIFPPKGVNLGDQSGDGIKDIAVISPAYNSTSNGYVLILGGRRIATDIEQPEFLPKQLNLYQNYPNPFNPLTNITYSLPERSFVTIKVYDLLGKEIAILVNEEKPAGKYEIEFDAARFNLSSGVYFYRITAGDYVSTKKMMLVK